jgi:hypothetical protein
MSLLLSFIFMSSFFSFHVIYLFTFLFFKNSCHFAYSCQFYISGPHGQTSTKIFYFQSLQRVNTFLGYGPIKEAHCKKKKKKKHRL